MVVDQGEAEPVVIGAASTVEFASCEVQDPLEVHNEPEVPDLGFTMDTVPAMEGASFEVQDLPEIQSEPELLGSGFLHQEEVEPAITGVGSIAEIPAFEVPDPLGGRDAPEFPESGTGVLYSGSFGSSAPEEAIPTCDRAWWGVVGSQEDPVLDLRNRIEVHVTVTVVHLSFFWILDCLLILLASAGFFDCCGLSRQTLVL